MGLIFLPKNAIKTHDLAAKTHKNSIKTPKNTLFPPENASEQSEAQLISPETPLFAPHRRLNPGKSMANTGNRCHYKAAATSVTHVLASSVPLYIKVGAPQVMEKLGPTAAGGGGGG